MVRIRDGKVGDGDGIDAELRELGAENEPHDEEDSAGDDEEGDNRHYQVAEEGWTALRWGIVLVVVILRRRCCVRVSMTLGVSVGIAWRRRVTSDRRSRIICRHVEEDRAEKEAQFLEELIWYQSSIEAETKEMGQIDTALIGLTLTSSQFGWGFIGHFSFNNGTTMKKR